MKIIPNGISKIFENDIERLVDLIDYNSLSNKDRNVVGRVRLAVKKLKKINYDKQYTGNKVESRS